MAKLAAAMAGIVLLSAAGWPGPIPVLPGASSDTALLAVNRAAIGSHRLQPDVLIVSARPLPAGAAAAVDRLHGVQAAETVDAAKIQVNGKYVQMLGVDPVTFRPFAARPTASSQTLWQNVADGQLAVSYLMGKQDKLPVGATAHVAGHKLLPVRIGGIGTVGIAGVDAVVSRTVAQVLGFPVGNAIVVSAPRDNLTALKARLAKLLPRTAQVQVLVAAPGRQADSTAGAAGSVAAAAGQTAGGGALPSARILTMLRAAYSRVGMPYVWGAAGPTSFDCSGLVQWSFAQAGIVMPRVAADQARTGPAVSMSQLQPGDLLFYHTDPTAPGYISHVAIYLGRGEMIQAPEPGMNVEVVPADFGSGFAGAVAVAPAIAAQVAGVPVG
jgi:cell wall-associated NlpC family hydrolase